MSISNIQERTLTASKQTIDFCKSINAEHLIPVDKKNISFELNASTAMANAIRRCANSEIDVLIMDFDPADFYTDDPFIISNVVQKRINLIPVQQIAGSSFSLEVKNNTSEVMEVLSSEITSLCSPTFEVVHLNPGKYIRISNIKMKKGTAHKDGAAHSFAGKIKYECLDKGKSSLCHQPTKYRLTTGWQNTIDPREIIKMTLNTLIEKVQNLTENKMNETYTIGNLLVEYVQKIDPTSKASCTVPYAADHIVVQADPQLLKKAKVLILQDLKKIKSAF